MGKVSVALVLLGLVGFTGVAAVRPDLVRISTAPSRVCVAWGWRSYVEPDKRYVSDEFFPQPVAEAVGILYLIIRDLSRGWTYGQGSCRKIKMGKELFAVRVNYVRVLARKHGAGLHTLAVIDRLVEYVLATGQLPTTIHYRGKSYKVESLINAVLSKA